MYIKKTIETPEGEFIVEAQFSKQEVDLIMEAGLSYLLQNGALPFMRIEDGEDARFMAPVKLEQ